MYEKGPDKIQASKSTSTLERGTAPLERFISDLEEELHDEVERIISEEEMIGEGRAARVFNLDLKRSRCQVCVKIWKPENEKLPIEKQKEIQYLNPEEEFNLQDELYLEGFKKIPRPIAYGTVGKYHILSMERIMGYTLQEVLDAEAKIGEPGWDELMKMLKELNIDYRVLHRDIHPGNVMIKSSDPLAENARIQGQLYFIDFGRSKRIYGRPTPEDYVLTIGQDRLEYTNDKAAVDALNPRGGSPNSPFAK